MIGRGAYGEVWMARGVTGALRAVKVVWREDYDHPESFEREFEAIKKYEPVSRRHPGLVPVLQVGRSDSEGFYYYVMELADDLEQGRDISPENYRCHSLMAQMRRDGRVSADECIRLGSNVAEGLDYLHKNNLIHRDVKPSNLIFTDGVCRLADLGLVALLGQQSFVGTEGFVAPEGPGTPASDIFSLGMVLYEASTGKDRLDFPDIPSSRDTGEKLEIWRRLNTVICKACAPKAKDRYENAMEMSLDLRGQPLPSRKRVGMAAAAAAAAITIAIGFGMWLAQQRKVQGVFSVQQAVPMLTIKSAPEGAVVYAGEDNLGTTPLELNPAEGVPVIYELRKPGYKYAEIEHTAAAGRPVAFDLKLEPSKLPQPGERWTNSLGIAFTPRQGGHVSGQPAEMKHFRKFIESDGRSFEGKVVRFQVSKENEAVYIVVVPPGDAEAFRFWLTDKDREDGFLSQEHHYEIEPFYFVEDQPAPAEEMPDDRDAASGAGANWQAFYLRVERQAYGSVAVKSIPEGMKVFQQEEFLGQTPVELPRVRSGQVEFELRGEGFTDVVLEGEVKDSEILELFANMEARKGVSFGREWKHPLGMKFVPLGPGEVMMAVWETRRKDYIDFAKATSSRKPTAVDKNERAATQPIVGIDREDARAFCKWLTERDRKDGTIGPADVYRLPTDEEWSRAVGLPLERGATPADRNGRISGIYPWGFDWPPPDRIDNFADLQGARQGGYENVVPGYTDMAAFAANVTSLMPNDRGISGLAGNVSEWVDTDYEKPQPGKPALGTVRGGNWRSASQAELLSSVRMPVPPDARRNTIGFRIVLAKETGK